MLVRASINSYKLHENMKTKSYFKGNNVGKIRIGRSQYRFDIKRKWGYQQNLYIMKDYWDEETHMNENVKRSNIKKEF